MVSQRQSGSDVSAICHTLSIVTSIQTKERNPPHARRPGFRNIDLDSLMLLMSSKYSLHHRPRIVMCQHLAPPISRVEGGQQMGSARYSRPAESRQPELLSSPGIAGR